MCYVCQMNIFLKCLDWFLAQVHHILWRHNVIESAGCVSLIVWPLLVFLLSLFTVPADDFPVAFFTALGFRSKAAFMHLCTKLHAVVGTQSIRILDEQGVSAVGDFVTELRA